MSQLLIQKSNSWEICVESRAEMLLFFVKIWCSINSYICNEHLLFDKGFLDKETSTRVRMPASSSLGRTRSWCLPRLTIAEKATPRTVRSSHQWGIVIRYCSFQARDEDCGCCVNISSTGAKTHTYIFGTTQLFHLVTNQINKVHTWSAESDLYCRVRTNMEDWRSSSVTDQCFHLDEPN